MSTTALDIPNPYEGLSRVQIRDHEIQLRDVDFGRGSLVARMAVAGYTRIPLARLRHDDLQFAASLCCDRHRGGQGMELEGYEKPWSALWFLCCPACGAVREIVWPDRAPEGAVVL